MPKLPVVFYKDKDGSIPLLEWFDEMDKRDKRIVAKCRARINALRDNIKLPVTMAKILRDQIWELRLEFGGVNYRILYFFSKTEVVVLSHGLWKEDVIPPKEIEMAIARKKLFETDPERYSYVEEENN